MNSKASGEGIKPFAVLDSNAVATLAHLLHTLLIQNLLHRQELDDSTRWPTELGAFLLGLFCEAEAEEKAAPPLNLAV